MRHRLFSWGLMLSFIGITTICVAQKKGDKSAKFLNFTFDKLVDPNEEITEPGLIGRLKGLKPSSQYPADAYYGSGEYGIGSNINGYAKPIAFTEEKFEGNDATLFRYGDKNLGYAGIVTYKQGKSAKERSYITIPFMDESGKKPVKMVAGKLYCIEMSISLAEASKFSTNNIGIMFVKNVGDYQTENIEEPSGPFYDDNTSGRIVYHHKKNRIYNSYGGWDKVCNTYKAKGDETGLVIGNFASNDKTKYETNKKIDSKKMEMDGEENAAVPAILPMAYYYVDNVRIKEIDTKDKCYCMKQDTTSAIQLSRTVITKDFVVAEKSTEKQNIENQIVYYGQGEKTPDETGLKIIEYVGTYLKSHPDAVVEIISHNDIIEDSIASENLDDQEIVEKFGDLSEKRADFVKLRLNETYEIPSDQITITSLGAEVNNKEGEGALDEDLKLAYNRRITFKIK